MPTSDLSRAAAALPAACRGPVERVLAAGPDERVELVLGPGGPLVVRLVRDARRLSGELAVLASLRSPRLARLVDGGTLPGGGAFLAREWVAGADLAAGAARGPADAALLVLEVALGLVELHRSGFAHGDLKPANLILREGGGVCLTDFGFARWRRSSPGGGRRGGTLGFVAPEVLVGGEATPASDLFSLGVTWLMLLGAPLPPPSSLYGRFPAESFVTAAGLGPSALPEAHRDLIGELLHRDPRARPTSAADFARRLAARLDVAPGSHGAGSLLRAAPEAPYWPRAAGREAVYRSALDRCAELHHIEVWRLPSAAEARAVAREVSLTEAVRGRSIQLVDLEGELERVADSGAFDRWLAALERRSGAATLVLAGSAEPWTRELLRALAGTQPKLGLVRCVGPEVAAADGERVLPPQGAAVMAVLLQRALPGEAAERIEQLAGVLAAETRGAAEDAAARVDALFRAGHVCDEGEGARVVDGVDAVALLRAGPRVETRILRALGEPQRRLLGALGALDGFDGLTVEDLLAVAGEGCTTGALDELVRGGWVELQVERGRRRVSTRVALSLVELGLDRTARRALYGRAAAAVAAQRGASDDRPWPLRYLSAGSRVVPELVAEARAAITRGAAPRVRAALQRLRERAAREAEALPGELALELALAWIHTDDVQSAQAELAPLMAQEACRQRATWLSALVARATRATALELELFRRAGDERSVARAEVHAALLAGDVARVEQLSLEYSAGLGAPDSIAELADEALAAHVDILGAAALGALRRGDRARVEFWVAAALAIAEHTEFAALRAAVASNVAIVRRRLGDLAAAWPMYARAVAETKALGRASALARARLALAGVLRDLGRVAEAEPLALEALGTRRRAGDVAGTALARGVYGLVLADRGHLHAASVELARAAEELERSGQAEQAALMSARLIEVRARGGAALPDLTAARAHAHSEPRIEIALARAAACAGDAAGAIAAAQRASHLADGLGFKQVAREAQLILRTFEVGARTGAGSEDVPPNHSSLVSDDERVFALLTGDEFASQPAFEFARELALRGRDDRAARLALAVAARDRDPLRRERAAALARSALERALAGAEPAVAASALRRLLGLPDPCPADLDRWQLQPEDEMDVLTVLGINERLVEQQDLDTLLRAIVDAALEVTGAERGFIVLEENGALSLDRALDSARGDLAADEVEFSSSIVNAALELGGPLRVADAGEDVQYSSARSVASFELRSVLCQPFTVEEGLRGVVLVDERRRPGAFGPREERLLGLLAGQAALALRQVRRLESITRLRDELAARVVERETRLEVAERRLEARGQVAPVEGLVGDSAPMQAVHKLLRRIAPSDLPVLVTGESGTGKELAARALHALSPRVKGPFVAENCAALPATLLESELFGSRKGSYTGAERDREGLFERADGGTLFLDEVGELPLDQQAKLLRVLETREVRRIGDSETRAVDFRLVVATHRDLAQEVREGRFREDLMYRLDTVRIVMPPLRERLEDVPLLVEHFVRLAGARDGRARRVAPQVMKALIARPWPGNVRELANEVARLLVLSERDLDDAGLLRPPVAPSAGAGLDLVRPLAELEREAILAALVRTGGDKREAAELLGISRAKVYQRLKEWGLGAAD